MVGGSGDLDGLVALVLERLASRRRPVSRVGFGRLAAGYCRLDAAGDLRVAAALVLANTVVDRTPGAGAAGDSESIRKTSIVSASASAPSRSFDQESAGDGFGWTRAWWHQLRGGAARELNLIGEGTSILQAAWGAFVIAGATWFLGRLLIGLWGVRDCRRRSRLIKDPDVVAEVESFRLALFDRGSRRGS